MLNFVVESVDAPQEAAVFTLAPGVPPVAVVEMTLFLAQFMRPGLTLTLAEGEEVLWQGRSGLFADPTEYEQLLSRLHQSG